MPATCRLQPREVAERYGWNVVAVHLDHRASLVSCSANHRRIGQRLTMRAMKSSGDDRRAQSGRFGGQWGFVTVGPKPLQKGEIPPTCFDHVVPLTGDLEVVDLRLPP